MKKIFVKKILSYQLILFVAIPLALCSYASQQLKKTAVIPVSGMIEPGLKSFIERATGDALAQGAKVIIYEIDTFGGELGAAFEISDIIANVDEDILTIAYVKTKAISAGSLIALSCKQLVMKKNTTIGDCAPIIQSKEGPKMLGEKIQSPLRAKFRSLAKKNGYPPLLAEAMVSKDIEILKIQIGSTWKIVSLTEYNDYNKQEKNSIKAKRTIVKKGKLLTMDATEAVNLKFAEYIVESIEEVYSKYSISVPVLKAKPMWSETMVRIIRKISPVLMLIGLAGIGLEVKSPGMIWPGVAGVFCLGLVFGGQYLVGMANYIEIILFLIGIVLIIIEVNFIPGFGVFGVSGILLIIASLVLSFQDFTIPKPDFPWQFATFEKNLLRVSLSIIGSIILFLVAGKWIVTSSGFRRLVLTETEESRQGFTSIQPDVEKLIGHTGTTESILRPSGTAIINDRRYDVITNGEFVQANENIRVVRTEGNRIEVEKS